VPRTARLSIRIISTSAKNCRVVGLSIRASKVGLCRVRITVQPRRGKPVTQTVTFRVTG
jgi:hypothetical protein